MTWLRVCSTLLLITGAVLAREVKAENFLGADEGKLLLTSGFSDLEGAGGGGLVPLALITGYGTSASWGANVHATDIEVRDYHIWTAGAAVGLFDRLELSYAHQQLDITGTALEHLGVRQDVFGAKVKLFGNVVYGQDSWLPQIAAGVEYKHNDGVQNSAAVGLTGVVSPTQLGAKSEHSEDYYLAATKVFLEESLVVNLVLRETRANEFGFLGFGGDRHSGYSLKPEGTIAYLLTRTFAVGAEVRSSPRNLSVDDESTAWDIFAGWTPTKNISLVVAYLNLGSILAPVTMDSRHQDGVYVSLQAGF